MLGLANTFLVMPGGCASGRMRCAFPALRASRLGDLWFLIVIPESQSDIRDPATLHSMHCANVTGSRLSPDDGNRVDQRM
jgi:hypothetical protein